MSPQERALIDAIRDDPDDDLRRLVYADWLEEHGQAERAELIRVQVELAKRPGARELIARERELLDKHRRAWLRPPKAPAVRFVRGLGEGYPPPPAELRAGGEKARRGGL